ncbi:MAG TPA: GNAT family N-acetyltransferase [Mycobacteriales bacterium]|nr:GNAT family N-acetyltransferase [Mycobacteriales bacterium]
MEPVEITAGRLHLRPWTAYDEDALVDLFSDPLSAAWTPAPVPFTAEEARRRLTEQYPQMWDSGAGAPFAVLDAVSGQVLAWVALFGITEGSAEVGWATAPAARGRAVASDAVTALCGWGFGALGLRRVEAVIAVGNWVSLSVAQKCGFTREGVRRRGMTRRGEVLDAWVTSLLSVDDIIDRRPLPPPPVLSDGVVTLRAYREQDAVDVARACDDPVTARWLPVPVPYTHDDGVSYVSTIAPAGWADGTSATLAVTDAADGSFVGDISLKLPHRSPLRFGEIGYWTAPWARGRGVAARATALLARWGLEELALNRVELFADVENTASQRAAEKAGFVREGVARQARPDRHGTGHDMALYGLTAADLTAGYVGRSLG